MRARDLGNTTFKHILHAAGTLSDDEYAKAKVKAFEQAGVPVADRPDKIPELMKEKLGS